jgi:hypothetical protein
MMDEHDGDNDGLMEEPTGYVYNKKKITYGRMSVLLSVLHLMLWLLSTSFYNQSVTIGSTEFIICFIFEQVFFWSELTFIMARLSIYMNITNDLDPNYSKMVFDTVKITSMIMPLASLFQMSFNFFKLFISGLTIKLLFAFGRLLLDSSVFSLQVIILLKSLKKV